MTWVNQNKLWISILNQSNVVGWNWKRTIKKWTYKTTRVNLGGLTKLIIQVMRSE
jgi:hypothetical protein